MEWRVGRQIALNVYEGDRPICQCHNEEDAKTIVDAVNLFNGVEYHPKEWLLEGELWGKVILLHVANRLVFLPDYFQDEVWLEVQKTIRECHTKVE